MDIGNMKNIRIDKKEFVKQHNEKIREGGKFAEVSILVETGSNSVIPYIHLSKVGTKEVAYLIDALKQARDVLSEEYPEALFYSEFMMKSEKKDL